VNKKNTYYDKKDLIPDIAKYLKKNPKGLNMLKEALNKPKVEKIIEKKNVVDDEISAEIKAKLSEIKKIKEMLAKKNSNNNRIRKF
jgi:DNA-binding protein H-NS